MHNNQYCRDILGLAVSITANAMLDCTKTTLENWMSYHANSCFVLQQLSDWLRSVKPHLSQLYPLSSSSSDKHHPCSLTQGSGRPAWSWSTSAYSSWFVPSLHLSLPTSCKLHTWPCCSAKAPLAYQGTWNIADEFNKSIWWNALGLKCYVFSA